ncbi:hypothetical protein BH18ACI4_BH18ACI4_29130 [soil metagenome]
MFWGVLASGASEGQGGVGSGAEPDGRRDRWGIRPVGIDRPGRCSGRPRAGARPMAHPGPSDVRGPGRGERLDGAKELLRDGGRRLVRGGAARGRQAAMTAPDTVRSEHLEERVWVIGVGHEAGVAIDAHREEPRRLGHGGLRHAMQRPFHETDPHRQRDPCAGLPGPDARSRTAFITSSRSQPRRFSRSCGPTCGRAGNTG